ADASGSSFGSGAPESGDANVAVDITATQLLFVQQPNNTEVSTAMSPNPTVKACDVNGNIDVDYSVAIDVTSSGSLASSPVSGTWSSGVATFADLTHTATGTGLSLTASDGSLTDVTSSTFDITEASGGGCASDLIISEVNENGGDKYVEIFNNTGADVSLGDYEIKVYANGNTSPNSTISLTSTSLADGDTWVLGNSGLSGVTDQTSGSFTPNGNDVVALSKNTTNIDVLGTIGSSSYFNEDQTAIRNSDITAPTTTYNAGDWSFSAYGGGDPGSLGSHTMDCGSAVDTNSEVTEGADAEPTTIASTVDVDGEEIQVFDFTFTDAGTSDGLATIIDEIQITQGSANDVADWTNAIAGAYLSGTDLGSDLAGTINSTNITFTSDDMISIADGGNETYSLKIYLKTDLSNITDNDNLEFALDYNNIAADASGSSFGSGAPESGDANCAIDINASELQFVQQPVNTAINVNMNPLPTVKACDANGNTDADYATAITMSSSGTMAGDPVTGSLSGGVASFTIEHTELGTNLTLTASSGSFGDQVSNTFDITELSYCTDLMISEYMEGNASNTAIELFNGTGSTVTLDGYILMKKVDNDGDWVSPLELSGNLPHGEIYLMVDEDGTDLISSLNTNGVEIDLLVSNTNQVLKVSGDDPIALFFEDGSKALTMVDVVGDGTNFQEVNLKRNSNIFAPNPVFTISEWTEVSPFSFDDFGSTDNPLPVTWKSVSAVVKDKSIDINWTTATETNNDYFSIEYSIDNDSFQQIGRVEGAGNASVLNYYSFRHNSPVSGENYYRIKQVDFNGNFDYSKIVSAKWEGLSISSLNIEFVHWSTDEQKALIQSVPGSTIDIVIYNLAGKKVYKESVKTTSAYYMHSIEKTYLQDGIYIMRVSSGENVARQKFAVSGF
ncbi:lamin tail domain-containing protein, partial [Salinivirga cyanobacteriivorans]